MIINAHTKIAGLIKHNPDALEAIVSLSPRFTKLRNPVLRKIIAARTSIAMAARIGGCSVNDFFNKLQPLGFEVDKAEEPFQNENDNDPAPAFMKNLKAHKIIELDVRPVIESGKDPLDIIIKKVQAMEESQVLKIINSFEPTPLIHLLGKKGFGSYTQKISDGSVNTYFFIKDKLPVAENIETDHSQGWDEILNRFKGYLETIDVRSLEMPLPLHTILEALNKLPPGKALFVYHKRIPVYLLPELEEQQFSYRIKEISDGEVHLLIYRN
jgi:uncharacterized protein (DUF2249 family)